MHVPDHAGVLPEHTDPMPAPDSPREAELLLFLLEMFLLEMGFLEMGFCWRWGSARKPPPPGAKRFGRAEGKGLT
jgi:hypothetical protein